MAWNSFTSLVIAVERSGDDEPVENAVSSHQQHVKRPAPIR